MSAPDRRAMVERLGNGVSDERFELDPGFRTIG